MKRHIDKIEDAQYERGYVYQFHFHLIWVTKYRRQVFTDSILAADMKRILCDVAEKNEIHIEKMKVMPDHIHLLISMKSKIAPSVAVKILKGRSVALFFQKYPDYKRDMFWGGHLWSSSYYMSTLGNMSVETVRKYIDNQYKKKSRIPPVTKVAGFLREYLIENVQIQKISDEILAALLLELIVILKQYKDLSSLDTLQSVNKLCVRLMSCLYTEEADIFVGHNSFHDYLKTAADKDVNDVREALIKLF